LVRQRNQPYLAKGESESGFKQGIHGWNQRLRQIIEEVTEADSRQNRKDSLSPSGGEFLFNHLILLGISKPTPLDEVHANLAGLYQVPLEYSFDSHVQIS
jgi:hypothetical protein